MSKEKALKKDSYKKQQIIKTVVEVFIILLALAVTMVVPRVFPGTSADEIISGTMAKFFDVGALIMNNYLRIIETATVLFFVWVLNKLIHWAFQLFLDKRTQSTATFTLLKSMIKYILVFIGVIFILQAWGVDSSTLLVSIGLLGFVVSFGAQGLIEDFLAGILIIMEKQYQVDDIVYIDGFRGRVLEINLRTTKFLDLMNLDVKYINNSNVRNVINASQRDSIALCDVGIEYGEDINKVENLLKEFLPTLKDKHDKILDIPKLLGVQTLGDSAVVIRITALTKEDFKMDVQRFLNKEIKVLFDQNNIGIPFPQITISQLKD